MSRRTPSPVDMTRPTILSVLQDRNPDITDEWAGKSYSNTTSGTDSFDLVKFDDTHPSVQKWADFTFEAIDLAYGDIYHQDIKQVEPNYQPVQLVDTNATSIVNEGSVDSLGSRWSHVVVKAPLRAAATHLRQSLGGPQQKPTLEHHLIEWTRPRALGQKPVTLKPDWVSFFRFSGFLFILPILTTASLAYLLYFLLLFSFYFLCSLPAPRSASFFTSFPASFPPPFPPPFPPSFAFFTLYS